MASSPSDGDFFSSGLAVRLFERYRAERGLDETMAQVEVRLRSGEQLAVERILVGGGFVIFSTEADEDDEYVAVPPSEIVEVRFGRREEPRQVGFAGVTSLEDEPES
ncbi:MAG TPA: hypothetical protein VK915_13140 [Gaiellaceae bacterium]|nr:hypothetical protein [Gaiellaceae bacterium]